MYGEFNLQFIILIITTLFTIYGFVVVLLTATPLYCKLMAIVQHCVPDDIITFTSQLQFVKSAVQFAALPDATKSMLCA